MAVVDVSEAIDYVEQARESAAYLRATNQTQKKTIDTVSETIDALDGQIKSANDLLAFTSSTNVCPGGAHGIPGPFTPQMTAINKELIANLTKMRAALDEFKRSGVN
jgi:hypothetical protein